jgi:hypothetical protein
LQRTWDWALSGPKGFCKEAWAVAISAHQNQTLTNSVVKITTPTSPPHIDSENPHIQLESLNKRKRLAG